MDRTQMKITGRMTEQE